MSHMRKLTLTSLASLAVVAVVAVACGGTDEPSMASVSGIWTATSMEFVSAANPAVTVDVIAAGGTATINLNDNGQYSATLTPPGGAPETTTGTWSYTMDTLTLVETGSMGDMMFDFALGNDTMTLMGANSEYDFDDNGTDEPAKLNIVLVR